MPEIKHRSSSLRITTNSSFSSGCQTVRQWDEIAKALVKSGIVFLNEGERIEGFAIGEPETGLGILIGKI